MPVPTRPAHGKATFMTGIVAVALLVITACGPKEAGTGDTAGATAAAIQPAPPPAAPATATLNDPQVTHVAVLANSIDSAAGELAKQKASAKAVKNFAQMMIKDHGAVNKEAAALAKKLNVTPEDNDVSRQLKTAAEAATATLQGLSGAAFDRAYIDNEVAYHQSVLDALNKTLIPGAQNAELNGLLDKVRPAVAAHLERAKSIQATLNK